MGVILLVTMASVLTNVSSNTCEPTDLYSSSDDVIGFGGGFVNGLYDSICSRFVGANDAIWGAYSNLLVGIMGQKGNLALFSADLWGLADFFCTTHSNFEYATSEFGGAITSTADFSDLFLYEAERCWKLFEGNYEIPNPTRHPLGKRAFFDCAEIIYDFTDGNYVSLAELYAKLSGPNFCGEDSNLPCGFFESGETFKIKIQLDKKNVVEEFEL